MLCAPNKIVAPVTAYTRCCFAFGFPVKKLNAANPSPRTAKIGRIDPIKTFFRPKSDDSTDACASGAASNISARSANCFLLIGLYLIVLELDDVALAWEHVKLETH